MYTLAKFQYRTYHWSHHDHTQYTRTVYSPRGIVLLRRRILARGLPRFFVKNSQKVRYEWLIIKVVTCLFFIANHFFVTFVSCVTRWLCDRDLSCVLNNALHCRYIQDAKRSRRVCGHVPPQEMVRSSQKYTMFWAYPQFIIWPYYYCQRSCVHPN